MEDNIFCGKCGDEMFVPPKLVKCTLVVRTYKSLDAARRGEAMGEREKVIELRACPACLAEIEAAWKKKQGRRPSPEGDNTNTI